MPNCKPTLSLLTYFSMAQCYICHKSRQKGFQVSHSSIKTRRYFKPNLHSLRVQNQDNKLIKIKICSKCYKRIRKDFWAGKKTILTPISLINQAKHKTENSKSKNKIDKKIVKIEKPVKKEIKKPEKKKTKVVKVSTKKNGKKKRTKS